MYIKEASPGNTHDWILFREVLYTGLDREFHEAETRDFLTKSDRACFICYDDDAAKPVGFVEVTLRNIVDGCVSSPVGYIEGIFVAPRSRTRGFGAALTDRAERWCREHGCSEMGTDAELGNAAAQAFHKKMGYQETFRVVEFRKPLT